MIGLRFCADTQIVIYAYSKDGSHDSTFAKWNEEGK